MVLVAGFAPVVTPVPVCFLQALEQRVSLPLARVVYSPLALLRVRVLVVDAFAPVVKKQVWLQQGQILLIL